MRSIGRSRRAMEMTSHISDQPVAGTLPADARSVACMLCGLKQWKRPYPERLDWLAMCVGCGLRWIQPQPADEELAEIYSESYFEVFGCAGHSAYAYRTAKLRTAQHYLELLERWIPPGRLLDVGSGSGEVLDAAVHRGWIATGVESNKSAEACAGDAAALTKWCRWEEFDGGHKKWDAVTCLEVIEHMRCPRSALNKMGEALRPGGCVLLTTPDVGSYCARVRRARWHHYHRDHLWYFGRATLSQLLSECGFDVVRLERARKLFTTHYVLGALTVAQAAPLVTRIARMAVASLPVAILNARLPAMFEGILAIARKR